MRLTPLLPLLTLLSLAVAFSIDLGASGFTIGQIASGRVDAVLNEQSKRKTPSAVAFANGGLLVGDAAVARALRFPGDACLRLPPRDASTAPAGFSPLPSDELGWLWNHDTLPISDRGLRLALLMAAGDLLPRAPRGGHSLTLTAPGSAAPVRRAERGAGAEAAGFSVCGVISQPLAVALAWAFALPRPEAPQLYTLLVVDSGAAHTEAAAVKIVVEASQITASLLAAESLPVGGDDVTTALVSLAEERFLAALPPRADDAWHQLPADNRSRQRLRVAAEKAKHVLSANEAATIYVELAVAGFDLDVIVTRADVATAAASVVAAAEAVIDRVAHHLPDVLPSHYTLMGAGTRILTLKDAIAAAAAPAVFVAVNTDEAGASGAALLDAMRCGAVRSTRKLVAFDAVTSPISLTAEPLSVEPPTTQDLFLAGTSCPSEVTAEFSSPAALRLWTGSRHLLSFSAASPLTVSLDDSCVLSISSEAAPPPLTASAADEAALSTVKGLRRHTAAVTRLERAANSLEAAAYAALDLVGASDLPPDADELLVAAAEEAFIILGEVPTQTASMSPADLEAAAQVMQKATRTVATAVKDAITFPEPMAVPEEPAADDFADEMETEQPVADAEFYDSRETQETSS
jgi:hypothetical protein